MKIGDKFNRWTVLSDKFKKDENSYSWYVECRCNCGKIKTLRGATLTSPSNPSKSCGCLQKEVASVGLDLPKIGEKFNLLTVTGYIPTNKKSEGGDGKTYVKTICDCGNVVDKSRLDSIRSGKTRSCGCLQRLAVIGMATIHGMANTPTHSSWTSMKQRCNNPKSTGYENYGGRGITYDTRWEFFQNFLEDMGERPEGTELDKIDNNGNYSKDNCRWSDGTIQTHNKRKRENCSSRYVGVSYNKDKNAWDVRLYKYNQIVYRGRFVTEEEAARAYDKHCLIHYGVVKNFPEKEITDHENGHIKEN